MNKVITFSNIKGGTGKSLLCALFAAYLKDQGINVAILDADIQLTLYRHRQRELSELPPSDDGTPPSIPFEVVALDTSNIELVKAIMDGLSQFEGCILVDCPGNIQDPALEHIFKRADIAVVPTHYNPDNIDATTLFIKAFKSVSQAQMVFVPNNVICTDERRFEMANARDNAKNLLEEYGPLTPRIKHSVCAECYSTIAPINRYQRNLVKFAFEPIVELINK